MTSVLKAIDGRVRPDAKIVLLGYPYLEGDHNYELIDRGEGKRSLKRDACGTRRGRTNFVTVGRCLYRIEDLGQKNQLGTIDTLNTQDHKHRFVFVSTQRLFAGTEPGFTGPNHELFATHVNPNRWFIQPFVDADSGLGTIEAPFGGDNVFYHPNPTGWAEEAMLLLRDPGVPKTAPGPVQRDCSLPHGAEGGFALPFSVTGIECSAAIPVVKDVIYSGGPCNGANLTGSGCRAALGFNCRIPSPTNPGYADPGDEAVCVKGNERIQVSLPG